MSNQSIEKFKRYLENQKDDFLRDGRRVEGIIRDIFPEEKSLISLLTTAWKAGVVTELRQTGNPEVTIAQFGDRLCQEYGLRESSALTAVRVWAYALRATDVVPNINVSSTPSSISQHSLVLDTKKCPFCAEEIKKDARKCRYCHSDISDDTTVKGVQSNELMRQQEALKREKQKLEWDRQEFEKMATLEAERKKLEAQRRELEEKKKQHGSAASPAYSKANEIGRDGRFIAYNDGTIIDTKTNLMWAAKDNGTDINWQNAKSYCENYRGGGYKDWRLPQLNEMATLYQETRAILLTANAHWASKTSGSEAALFNFYTGGRRWDPQSSDHDYRALPVRSGK